MKEIRIIGNCHPSITIGDLSLTLRPGEAAFVSLERAAASRDLQWAQRSRGVFVQHIERCREKREPPPPEAPKSPLPVTRQPSPKPPVPHQSSLEAIKRLLVDPLRAELVALRGAPNQVSSGEIRALLDQVRAALADRPRVPAGQISPSPSDDAPIFIPSHIGSGATAEIDIVSETSHGGGLAEAAEALKAFRKRK